MVLNAGSFFLLLGLQWKRNLPLLLLVINMVSRGYEDSVCFLLYLARNFDPTQQNSVLIPNTEISSFGIRLIVYHRAFAFGN